MYCSQCGKEIPDNSKFCNGCGSPVSKVIATPIDSSRPVENLVDNISQKPATKKTKALPYIIACGVILIALIAIIISVLAGGRNGKELIGGINSVTDGKITGGTETELAIVIDILSLTRDEVLSAFPNAEDESTIKIPGTFAGSTGIYKVFFASNETDVDQLIFERDSDDYDSDAVVDEICDCLGKYSEYDAEWNKYEWYTDKLELLFYVDERMYFYETDSYINNSSDTSQDDEEERAEADDYDEFKYAVDVCIQYVPNCMLDLDYTDDDTSYSINLDDEIIGILGTKIDSWDAVALTDPDKEDALLHHEQISIALIMACDSDITYEDAKKIFDEAKEEGSAKISSGIYFFEGMAEGMYAGGVDITWLD